MLCADGTECWTPESCRSGIPCLKVESRQPEPGPPEPFTLDLNRLEWKTIDLRKE